MNLSSLQAISPVDGRYRSTTQDLAKYFSESALIKYRIYVEIEYFIALCETGLAGLSSFDRSNYGKLREIFTGFSDADAQEVKDTEKVTNHDVKAVEYFIKKRFDNLGLQEFKEFIHFGLTSQDINNTAIPYTFKLALAEVYYPQITKLIERIKELAADWKDVPLLAHTHGQPASPTKLGKEFLVFAERLEIQLASLKQIPNSAKFGGATGNFNAHHIAYPQISWVEFSNQFVNETLGLSRAQHTTQIEHYDQFAAQCDALKRINTIIVDMDRDIWAYISKNYFKQKIKEGEVGSSAMPHKVNPIDFENAEGNAGLANALFEFFAAKLPVSRLQRDLTDSTVLRNVGVPLAHTMITIASTIKGLNKLLLNEEAIAADLENNWAVVAEAIQTVLRREAYPNPYEALKDLTRTNQKITAHTMAEFIDGLQINEDLKAELKQITPFNYTGVF
ncbi:adenylosuccinate lyase [Pedobacter antarcticus 4BY]|uniref:Adenylosuccinate lyase n=2 Tax=Pedobacter antarcticus TaxID=34086 RepID=A0A081PFZ6_9SPHI|nr:adenylosuccinate lyase [Pedobacter antarcticus]KEQ29619.1 adenylosuccinate lyase [Pedobacter antarcticus 4BY]SFE59086.1 adenylosuccinate lyase [Pedobacter antarcticus]